MIRKIFLVCICLALVLCLSLRLMQADEKPTPGKDIQKLVGTWKRIGSLDKDGKMMPVTGDFVQFKLVTPTHFTWFYANPKTRLATIGFSGRCTLKGNTYSEFIDLSAGKPEDVLQSAKPEPNNEAALPADSTPFVCKCRLEGNRWYHELPGAVFSDNMIHIEVWERLKPGEKMF